MKHSTKEIEDIAINYVVNYLKKKGENPKIVKKHVDVISDGKWIEVKGCMKKETNIRIVPQALDYIKKHNKLNDFFIYYVYDIASGNPKLLIFNYDTFNKHKVQEIKWIIQPFKIIRETRRPKVIQLK